MTTATENTSTVAELLAQGRERLAASGVPEPEANAEFLLAAALGCGRAQLHVLAQRVPAPRQANNFLHLVRQRCRRIPLAYVLGSQPFLGLDIKVTPAVLVPRPETEQLVELAVRLARERFPAGAPLNILEIGTGSGCISVALAAALPAALVYATDISADALRLAEENARRHRVEGRIRFVREDLFKPGAQGPRAWADLLVSNPPYIPSGDLAGLEPEVLREPFLALDGGKDGLGAVRAIAADAARQLKPGGWLALEIGAGQAAAVRRLLEGFSDVETPLDFAGKERFVLARRK